MEREIGFRYLTASGIVETKENRLYQVIVTPDGSNASYADVYNGVSTNDPKFARLRVTSNVSKVFNFIGGQRLERGLYIAFESNLQAVTVRSKSPA